MKEVFEDLIATILGQDSQLQFVFVALVLFSILVTVTLFLNRAISLWKEFVIRRKKIWRADSQESKYDFSEQLDDVQPLSLEGEQIFLDQIYVKNFKGIDELSIDLRRESTLVGDWTCIAGINGSGKSSILQAIAIILLGEDLVVEIGRDSLRKMRRKSNEDVLDSSIIATLSSKGKLFKIGLSISQRGVSTISLGTEISEQFQHQIWELLGKQMLVSYGATRNLSDHEDTRYLRISKQVQSQMTLFDTSAQLSSAQLLLSSQKYEPARQTFIMLIRKILDEESISARHKKGNIRFQQHGADLDALELPDGFRSTVAWIADLCMRWHEQNPSFSKGVSSSEIRGIVLLDEMGLHLHASFEGTLVSKLRRALPNVQFIISTHSPLVLASFDRNELVILDRSKEGGIRELDRQIFGMTMDDVYEWLMGTSPSSNVVQEFIDDGMDKEAALYLYQSKNYNEEDALKRLEKRTTLVDRLTKKKL